MLKNNGSGVYSLGLLDGIFLRWEGHTCNHKRVYPVWKQEQLNLRRKPKRPIPRKLSAVIRR